MPVTCQLHQHCQLHQQAAHYPWITLMNLVTDQTLGCSKQTVDQTCEESDGKDGDNFIREVRGLPLNVLVPAVQERLEEVGYSESTSDGCKQEDEVEH